MADDAAHLLRGECCANCSHRIEMQDYEGDGEYTRPLYWLSCQKDGFLGLLSDRINHTVFPHDCCNGYQHDPTAPSLKR